MGTASLISRLSQAVDLLEQRRQQNRPWKVVKVRRGYHEHQDVALDRHFAARPEDQDADVVLFDFFSEEIPGESQDRSPSQWALKDRGP
jgi:hypothetical protein